MEGEGGTRKRKRLSNVARQLATTSGLNQQPKDGKPSGVTQSGQRVGCILMFHVSRIVESNWQDKPVQQLPNIVPSALEIPSIETLREPNFLPHRPRILILYGSLRPQSFSRKLAMEAQRLLEHFGAEARLFDPHELPLLDSVPASHPKVQELRQASLWSEGHVWISPERHGTLTAVFKNQIDWLPLEEGSVRPTQGRTLAVMQVCGGSQSFNVVNALRVLGRWMRMLTIPNQSSVAKAWQEFDDEGRMKPSAYYDRVVDVMEELVKFTLLVRGRSDYLVDRYSERKGAIEAVALAAAAGVVEAALNEKESA